MLDNPEYHSKRFSSDNKYFFNGQQFTTQMPATTTTLISSTKTYCNGQFCLNWKANGDFVDFSFSVNVNEQNIYGAFAFSDDQKMVS
jgi:hypothetical protein